MTKNGATVNEADSVTVGDDLEITCTFDTSGGPCTDQEIKIGEKENVAYTGREPNNC